MAMLTIAAGSRQAARRYIPPSHMMFLLGTLVTMGASGAVQQHI